MRYKTQNDIDFGTFRDFAEQIEGLKPSVVAVEVMNHFFKSKNQSLKILRQFEVALKTEGKFRYRIDTNFKKAGKFIDADTYLTTGDKLSLAKLIVKKKWWQFKDIKWSITTVMFAEAAFIKFAEPIKERHPWIYNPPILPSPQNSQMSLAIEYQKDFVQDYGSYMEIVFLLTKGDFTKEDIVTGWSLDNFLFKGEYLLRKKRIETI